MRTANLLAIASVFGSAFVTLSAMATDQPRPNIVFMMADDLGWADVEFHGGNVPTPNLSRLRDEGRELRQHYVAPVCSPTRAGLLTGRYWSRFGVTTPTNTLALPMQTVTLASALRESGYETCITGKWHLGSKPEWGPNHFGFDHSYGSLAGGVSPWSHFYKKGPFTKTWHRNGQLISEEGHVTDLIVDEAIRWIQSRDDSRPFFLYVPFTAVHLPIREPDRWLDRVPKEIIGEVPRQYAACVLHLDDAVGRIVGAVESTGKSDQTLFVFTSDNGGSTAENNDTKYPDDDCPNGKLPGNNFPLRGRKAELYEGGTRVPTIARWIGTIEGGTFSDTPVHIVDWMPTLCELAKADTKAGNLHWDGRNIWPALSGNGLLPERSLYSAGTHFRSKALRQGDWKLIVFEDKKATVDRLELFDLADDPNEKNNLADSEPSRVAEMLKELRSVAATDSSAVAETDNVSAPKEQQLYEATNRQSWKTVFFDSGTENWKDKWFLDGEVGKVSTGPSGMTLTAGPEFKNDAHHMVLWTKGTFAGDLKIEYDYTRLDSETRCVNILYIQASGSGKAPYVKDISAWNELRRVPSMRTYYNNMNTYHISYAAFPNNEDTTSYIRGRRYMPNKNGLKGTELKPDYYPEGLFEPGVPHKVAVIKKEKDILLRVQNPDGVRYFRMTNADLPPVTEGRIGLRHMFTRSSRYSNFRVSVPE